MKYLKIYESVHDTKDWIEEVVSNCKDIMLEISDIFDNREVTKKYDSWSNIKGELNMVTVECKFVVGQGINKSIREKINNNMGIVKEVHENLIRYMSEEGFKINQHGSLSTHFNLINGNLTYTVSFSKELDKDFIGHLRYLKKYNLFESGYGFNNNDYNQLKDCFLSLSDIDCVKFLPGSNLIEVSISLDRRVESSESSTSEWGVKYKPVIDGDIISKDIANSIEHCLGLDFVIVRAEVTWKNAGEWSVPGKEGIGPGLMSKVFSKTGRRGPFDNPVKGNYNLKDLCDFIESKGDKLRNVKIEFIR